MNPLTGIKVLDLTTVAMGPLASQWLGDFGADVIKIEVPAGDSSRQTGPAVEAGMAALYLGVNRNKRSIVLDLKKEHSKKALLKLIDGADVLMHNIRPQKLAKLGIDPDQVLTRNPKLIYASLLGFGEAGRYGGRPAYDDIIQGMSGNANLMARQNGKPNYFPTISADKTTGLMAAMAILAALSGRHRTGRGVAIEIPMFECMAAFNLVEHLYGSTFNPPIAPMGYSRVLSSHRQPYKTSDDYICLMPYTDAHWHAFFEAADAHDAAADPRFKTMADRTKNIDQLYELTGKLIFERTTGEWLAICERLSIPAAPILGLDDLLRDAHLADVGFFEEVNDPSMGRLRFSGVPVLFDGVRPEINLPPRLGEHTRDVLLQAGVPLDDVEHILADARGSIDSAT
ncbi:CaiB/BaiF CoA transferase family protein [Paraburkholderia saeva]|nr:CoA transferase [Paraburkholderia saeva]